MRFFAVLTTAGLFAGCSAPAEGPIDPADIPVALVSPLTELDLIAATQASVQVLLDTTLVAPWGAHRTTLGQGTADCPLIGSGEPDGVDIAGNGLIDGGTSYSAACAAGGTTFGGYLYWELAAAGDAADRALIGDAVVSATDAVAFEFDGAGDDHLTVNGADWTYASDLNATISGTLAATALSGPGGLRTSLGLELAGGAAPGFEAVGDVLLFDTLYQGQFDSVHADLTLEATASSLSDCTEEPRGVLRFRDANAHWYDVVFAPKYLSNLEYEDETYSACDGCGTVYWRGYRQREICLDFDFLWDALAAPDLQDFSL